RMPTSPRLCLVPPFSVTLCLAHPSAFGSIGLRLVSCAAPSCASSSVSVSAFGSIGLRLERTIDALARLRFQYPRSDRLGCGVQRGAQRRAQPGPVSVSAFGSIGLRPLAIGGA